MRRNLMGKGAASKLARFLNTELTVPEFCHSDNLIGFKDRQQNMIIAQNLTDAIVAVTSLDDPSDEYAQVPLRRIPYREIYVDTTRTHSGCGDYKNNLIFGGLSVQA